MAGPDLLAFGSSETAKDVLKQMKDIAEFKKYKVIILPDDAASNCLYINGCLIHCTKEEYPKSNEVFFRKVDGARAELKNSEFAKINRYFTCRSLIFSKPKPSPPTASSDIKKKS